MPKRVIDVGNCDLDHGMIRCLLETEFAPEVVRCHTPDEAFAELRKAPADLVLVNRILDRDQSAGLDIIRAIKTDEQLKQTPCMLLTNFAHHQAHAVGAGAEPGFGKAQLSEPSTRDKLARYLSPPT